MIDRQASTKSETGNNQSIRVCADELAAFLQARNDRYVKPLRRTKNARSVAVHEAGHAIASLAEGVPLSSVHINPGGSGECSNDTGYVLSPAWKQHDHLMILMAGPMAAEYLCLYSEDKARRQLSADNPPIGWVRFWVQLQARDRQADFTKAIKLGTERQVWLACRRAARLLIRQEAELLRLANELLRRRILYGDANIRAVAAGKPPPVISEARLRTIETLFQGAVNDVIEVAS